MGPAVPNLNFFFLLCLPRFPIYESVQDRLKPQLPTHNGDKRRTGSTRAEVAMRERIAIGEGKDTDLPRDNARRVNS